MDSSMFGDPAVLQGLALIGTFIAMTAAQELFAANRFPKLPYWRLEAFAYTALLFLAYVTVPFALAQVWPQGWSLFGLSWMGLWAIPAGIAALSFAEYWFHRSEHRFDWMWLSMHQIHHYPERVDVWGTAMGHPIEMITQAALATTVNVALLGLDPSAAAVSGYVLTVLGLFQHMDIRTPRWLGFLIARPEAHFLHHERGVHGRNYSELPLWDMLFGTFVNPDDFRGEVGLGPDVRGRVADMLMFADVSRPPGGAARPAAAAQPAST